MAARPGGRCRPSSSPMVMTLAWLPVTRALLASSVVAVAVPASWVAESITERLADVTLSIADWAAVVAVATWSLTACRIAPSAAVDVSTAACIAPNVGFGSARELLATAGSGSLATVQHRQRVLQGCNQHGTPVIGKGAGNLGVAQEHAEPSEHSPCDPDADLMGSSRGFSSRGLLGIPVGRLGADAGGLCGGDTGHGSALRKVDRQQTTDLPIVMVAQLPISTAILTSSFQLLDFNQRRIDLCLCVLETLQMLWTDRSKLR